MSPSGAALRAAFLSVLLRLQSAITAPFAPTFNFTVSDGGGFTLTVGNWTEDGRSVPPPAEATFTLQSQFSEPGVGKWTTLQPPWGGVPANFVVDRSGEAEGRTVVRLNGSYDGLWSLERVYQIAGHRVLASGLPARRRRTATTASRSRPRAARSRARSGR